ncbi:MAG: ImmA/IrrE family metallo-endopeptidase [Elusimicrobiota bacterium]
MKALAREVRGQHGLNSCRVGRADLRRIYKAEGIRIDKWPHRFKDLRGAYFNDELGPTVMLAPLPTDPLVFTMAHELKHHLVDRSAALSFCGLGNNEELIEIGAEVFAAEMLFPEQDFSALMRQLGVASLGCTPAHILRVKRDTATTLSYMGLVKRAEFLGFASPGSLPRQGWRKLEEQTYGLPSYRRERRRFSAN